MTKEGIIKISTKSEDAKRTILKAIEEETGMNIQIPKGELKLQQSVYDEITIRIIQQIILNNQISLVTIETLKKKSKSKKEDLNEEKQEEKQTKIRKASGGRPNKLLEKIESFMQVKKKVTMKELMEHTGGSQAGIRKNLNKLIEEGKIVYLEKGNWRIKNFYDDCLDVAPYSSIVDYIVEYNCISKEKVIENFSKEEAEFVLNELEKSAFIEKLDEEKYEVSVKFRIWYYIRKNPHVQWNTIKVTMAQKLIDTDKLSSAVNALIREKRIARDGQRGYVIN